MSLSELARRASVGKATLSGLEAGTRNPTLDTLHAVAPAPSRPRPRTTPASRSTRRCSRASSAPAGSTRRARPGPAGISSGSPTLRTGTPPSDRRTCTPRC
ncbi:helix-turn-helix domain-containing protein [Pseudonocardia sp. RS010]|uniref:helix-turn-helix domain-containing protein n=1 Tax=Pseudonocardia sp. RS010 TaxID=3385979 RepID=UPI0039A1606A